MRTFSKAASKVAFHESGSSKSGPKYGPGDKPDKYKSTIVGTEAMEPSYTLVHIT